MIRIGHGYDVHRLCEGRKLILGGVDIPYEKGLLGHSDADVLTHAVADALLGAAAMGDIGKLFPDNDPKYEGADSLRLLKIVVGKLSCAGYSVGNITDCTNNANITSSSDRVGGIAGECNSNANNTYTDLTNNGVVIGTNDVGGIFGRVYQFT